MSDPEAKEYLTDSLLTLRVTKPLFNLRGYSIELKVPQPSERVTRVDIEKRVYVIRKDSKFVGVLDTSRSPGSAHKDLYEVNLAVLQKSHRGKGLMLDVMTHLIKNKKLHMSDTSVSLGARKTWYILGKRFNRMYLYWPMADAFANITGWTHDFVPKITSPSGEQYEVTMLESHVHNIKYSNSHIFAGQIPSSSKRIGR
jgi:hypothetical protein